MPKHKKSHRPLARIESRILAFRGHKVILDSDLAAVYGIPTRVLNQAVKRNLDRFPEDFVFQLTKVEYDNLRSQIVTASSEAEAPSLRSQIVILKKSRGKHKKYLPYAFTEHGAIMAANVLKSKRAVQMSVFVVRAFVRLRETAIEHRELAEKLKELERRVGQHDSNISAIIEAIRELMTPREKPKRKIGFEVKEPKVKYSAR
ncbi:MAG: ORF6N domain-containing protein [Ignavibacteriae bacterium]|nr:ORF6N domain-containing protein [Ignavibacteriota bacterium]